MGLIQFSSLRLTSSVAILRLLHAIHSCEISPCPSAIFLFDWLICDYMAFNELKRIPVSGYNFDRSSKTYPSRETFAYNHSVRGGMFF